MGNGTSHQRCHLYWGAVLLVMIPGGGVGGWNVPYFGGGGGPTGVSDGDGNDGGVRVDSIPIHRDSDPLTGVGTSADSDKVDPTPLFTTVAAPLIGPVDAQHLRYAPSYFSKQVPPRIKQLIPALISTLRSARLKLYHLLWYKPPVGVVGAWSLLRVLENLYGVFSPPPPSSGDEALADAEGRLGGAMKSLMPGGGMAARFTPWGGIGAAYSENLQNRQARKRRRKRRRKVRKGRSFDLDRGDRSYDEFGGVETVRVRACREGLRLALESADREAASKALNADGDVDRDGRGPSLFGSKRSAKADGMDDKTTTEYRKDIGAALGALQLSCPPRGSREYFVEQSAEALSALSAYLVPEGRSEDSTASSIQEQNIRLLLRHSSRLIELRALDALVRTLRDRHLLVATRLRRTRDYWKWHVNLSGGSIGLLVQVLRKQIVAVFPALRMGVDDYRDRNQKEYELATATLERELEWLGKAEGLLLRRPAEMEVGDLLSVAGHREDRRTTWWDGLVSGRHASDDASTKKPSLTESVMLLLQSKSRIWYKEAEDWSREARGVIKSSLDETISSSFTPVDDHDESDKSQDDEVGSPGSVYAESQFLDKWANYDDSTSGAYSWLSLLSLVDCAASPKRVGERRQFQISSLASRIKRYDFLGLPSSALALAAASSLHDNVIAPHKQEIVDFFRSIFAAIWGIVEFRFYAPMKDIVLDLLNRRPRMVDPFALLNEQTSLDNMLMDLGVGDGTRQTRAAALAAASRMYEQEVAGGAIRGILRGRVAQLMLIQIQQLKADLLQAMDQIDNLVDANRLNVQLVASIPALLILFFGSRALYLFVSNIRMKDFRLPQDVHAEMSDYLKKAEECLVLSNYQLDASAPGKGEEMANALPSRVEACLGPKDMGKLLLLLHSYLNLLDYMSPPFPGKQCDSIHQSIQNLLLQGQMSTSRQLELLKVIQAKHKDLLKSL